MTTSLSVFSKNLPIQKDHHFKNSTTPKFNRHRPLGKKRSKTNGVMLGRMASGLWVSPGALSIFGIEKEEVALVAEEWPVVVKATEIKSIAAGVVCSLESVGLV